MPLCRVLYTAVIYSSLCKGVKIAVLAEICTDHSGLPGTVRGLEWDIEEMCVYCRHGYSTGLIKGYDSTRQVVCIIQGAARCFTYSAVNLIMLQTVLHIDDSVGSLCDVG